MTYLYLGNLVSQESLRLYRPVSVYYLHKIAPKADLHPSLEQPRARLDAILGADLVLQVLAEDQRPVPGLPVPDVNGGRLADVPVESDGEDLALVAGDVLRVEVDAARKVSEPRAWGTGGRLTCGHRGRLIPV